MTRSRAVWLILAAVAGGLAATAQERFWPKSVTAQTFIVVDSYGKKRAELGLSGKDQVFLRLYDEHGRAIWSAPEDTRVLPLEISR